MSASDEKLLARKGRAKMDVPFRPINLPDHGKSKGLLRQCWSNFESNYPRFRTRSADSFVHGATRD
jgi:hypothetical protein